MTQLDLINKVKENSIIDYHTDDNLIGTFVSAAVTYAEGYQHLPENYYETHEMSGTTLQGVIMLASFFYESRDGSTAGFFGDNAAAAKNTWETVNTLLRLDRSWSI